MNHEPQIQVRAAQHYAAIRMIVPMDSIYGAVEEAFAELFRGLAGNGIAASGPPFIRYLVTDMAAGLEIEPGRALSHRPVQGAQPREVGGRHRLPDQPGVKPRPSRHLL
jgi:hypothetical protein